MTNLIQKKCQACVDGTPPLAGTDIDQLYNQLGNKWKVINEHHLEKKFAFEDFQTALDFTNKIGALAEEEGHHPDIFLSWGQVTVLLWTHKANGLTESDFILAAKIDQI